MVDVKYSREAIPKKPTQMAMMPQCYSKSSIIIGYCSAIVIVAHHTKMSGAQKSGKVRNETPYL